MTIVNGSFEDQASGAQPGLADGWSSSETYTAQEFAEFTVLDIPAGVRTAGQEGFEGEWPTSFSDGFIHAFVAYFDDIDPAFFDPAPQSFEDMEDRWGTAPQGVSDFLDLTPQPAVFADGGTGPGADAFVESWEYDGNGDELKVASLQLADLEFAEFDTTNQTFEDYEEEWDNDDYNWSFPASGYATEITPAYFSWRSGISIVIDPFESFEHERFDLSGFGVTIATDRLNKTAHLLTDGWIVTLYNEGGRLPAGLLSNTNLFVQNGTANDFQVAAQNGGTIIDITDTGFGTHSIKHDLTYWWTEELEGF